MIDRRSLAAMLAVATTLAYASTALAQLDRLAAIGDSLSDEYSEESYSYAKNWTMQLVQYRGVSMGPTAAQASQPGGTWGEPRRAGYQNNWARYGADSATMLSDGQPTGVASQVGAGGVTHVVLAIGTNDFSPSTNAYFNIYWGFWGSSQINAYVNQRVANINAALDTLEPTGVKLVLCNYVDFGVAPVTRQFFPNGTRRNRVTAAITQVNAQLLQIAYQRGLVLADINALATVIFGTNTALKPTLTIGGVAIDLNAKDTANHSNPLAGFVDDGAHPHTTLQGVFANVLMAGVNAFGSVGLAPFSDAEILQHAGLAYGGSDTLFPVVGAPESYVRNFACPADFDANGFVTGEDFDAFIATFEAGDSAADIDVNGFVTGDDFDTFTARFTAGC